MARPLNQGVSKLTIRNRAPGTISTGANTEVLLDGQPLKGVSFLKLEFKSAKMTKVVIEMYAEVEVETDIELQQTEINPDYEYKIGKSIYVLGKYETIGTPVIIDKKKVAES